MTKVTTQDQRWIDARPFRAHLLHLSECTGFDWQTVALVAKIPPTVADRLLHGRAGRPVRRINPDMAWRLYEITPHHLQKVRERRVPAGHTRTLLTQLLDHGWPLADIASLLEVPADTVTAVVERQTRRIPKLLALRTQVVHASALDVFGRITSVGQRSEAVTQQAA